jgi:hypothetical protein
VSIVQLIQDLNRRVTALEDESRAAKEKAEMDRLSPTLVVETPRKMCPKCGVKPNHFFHVKNCQGQKQKEEYGENAERRRDPGTT